jgi:nitrite reductase/ring-hydroxylating ferredoxin subunit
MNNSSSPTWHAVCAADALQTDQALGVEVAGRPIGLYKLEDGSVHALSNICTHEFALLSNGFVEGGRIECPLHQACFEIRTGKCHGPMAETDLQSYPVRIVDRRVEVAV